MNLRCTYWLLCGLQGAKHFTWIILLTFHQSDEEGIVYEESEKPSYSLKLILPFNKKITSYTITVNC